MTIEELLIYLKVDPALGSGGSSLSTINKFGSDGKPISEFIDILKRNVNELKSKVSQVRSSYEKAIYKSPNCKKSNANCNELRVRFLPSYMNLI